VAPFESLHAIQVRVAQISHRDMGFEAAALGRQSGPAGGAFAFLRQTLQLGIGCETKPNRVRIHAAEAAGAMDGEFEGRTADSAEFVVELLGEAFIHLTKEAQCDVHGVRQSPSRAWDPLLQGGQAIRDKRRNRKGGK
jgi:hypothetical protein